MESDVTKPARLEMTIAALALLAAATSCGRESAQQPQSKAQQPASEAQVREPSQPQDQRAQQSEPHRDQAEQAQQPQAQQPRTDHAQNEPQSQANQKAAAPAEPAPQAQQARAQASQPSPNDISEQAGHRSRTESLSQNEVRQLQLALQQKGFRVGPLDGRLGPQTKRALSQFQRSQRLQQTGTPDEQTLTALGVGTSSSTSGQGPADGGGLNTSETPPRRTEH